VRLKGEKEMEIQIAKIYPPKQAGWSASIKDNLGNYFGVKEALVSNLSEGQTISADVVTKDKAGKTYRDIVKIHGMNGGGSSAPSHQASAPAAPRYGSQDDATAERIFVCGVVNSVAPKIYEKLGTIDSEKLAALVQIARVTWASTLGNKGGA
jgi:hypothetical protein